ncbi:phiSA1p31-related protein [Streptomyces sp. NPDC057217]|uniref:phiSA1p31-related protein n=1 Tax=Streptomyces sp. NPDC057217 TaxID=3346054 RepID=UPI003632DD25
MTEFKVGDKVRHTSYGNVEITYGPYTGEYGDARFVVRRENGRESVAVPERMTPLPKFAVGDTVEYEYGEGGKLIAGPFRSNYHETPWWVVETANGAHMAPTENSLTKAEPAREIKVGDRVRVVKDDEWTQTGEFVGRLGRVLEIREDGRSLPFRVKLDDPSGTWDDGAWWCTEVELVDEAPADTETVNGVVYDLGARYRDKEGDVWGLGRFDGMARGTCDDDGNADIDEGSSPLSYIVDRWGPLTRVTT